MENIKNISFRKFTDIVLATHFFKRLKGLLFTTIERNEAFIIPQCCSIHTIGMRYSIDVIFLNHNYELIKYVYSIKPNRFLYCKEAKYVIEVKAENYLSNTELKLLIMKCIKIIDTSQIK